MSNHRIAYPRFPYIGVVLCALISILGCGGGAVTSEYQASPDKRYNATILCPLYETAGAPWVDVRLEDAATKDLLYSIHIKFERKQPTIVLRDETTPTIVWASDSSSFSVNGPNGKIIECFVPK